MNAQTVTDYITDLSGPRGLLLNGNDLYIAEATAGKILKVDITQASPTPVEVVTGLIQPRALALDTNNNMLYIAEWGNERIIKINITQSSPTLQVVTTNITTPYSLALSGNELFIADSLIGKILKLNITDAIPTVSTEVITGLGYPQSIAINGNDLYISEGTNDLISKIDVTQTTPTKTIVLATTGSPFHMSMISGKLYFTEIVTDKLASLDVNAATPTTSTDVVTGINGAYGLVYDGTDFYVGALFDNKIVKVENLLSINENEFNKNNVKIYPNPTSSFLKISGLQKPEPYKIYNNLGQQVTSGTISKSESIDVTKYMNGIYLITFSSGTSHKFIKK
ncbi:T9SS type A sorting domain-containing protein [Aurantibacter sp.]|uniref:T9SS type A sorting domain-containing protein n=1 Tax=Aurantibacter sp. TaxID=2807103 RepID=UPI0035C7B726